MWLFRVDLDRASIKQSDQRGRKVVLHSLRHSLGTMLAASSVLMAVAQRIMRHRDIRLTAEVYTDEGPLPLAAAVRSLPSVGGADRPGPEKCRIDWCPNRANSGAFRGTSWHGGA